MKKRSLWNIYGFSIAASLIILLLVGFKNSFGDFVSVLILALLEVTFSFDNAVVNAKILSKMSRLWQQLFMTVGILVAVFGVRVLLPVVIVSASSGKSLSDVTDLALHHAGDYAELLHKSHPMIAAFGGMFLLMLFLDFIFTHREVRWLASFEKAMHRLGKLEYMSVFISLVSLLGIIFLLVPSDDQLGALTAGLIGIITYIAIDTLDSLAEHDPIHQTAKKGAGSVMKAGLVGFLYLEMIDASFSLDGVIGAFAITTNIVLIAAGLGIGALFVRSMTIHMLHRGVLGKYRYMEHGAHYAIGVLALVMLLGIRLEIPEFITGLSGVLFISLAIIHSHLEAKREGKKSLI